MRNRKYNLNFKFTRIYVIKLCKFNKSESKINLEIKKKNVEFLTFNVKILLYIRIFPLLILDFLTYIVSKKL